MSGSDPATQNVSAFVRAHDALTRRGDIQFNFPRYEVPKTPDWLVSLGRFLQTYSEPLAWLFWIIVALVAAAIVFAIVRQYWPLLANWKSKAMVPQAETVAWHPSAVQARRLLHESDALAAEGRYSEAVHLLLLRSIEDIDSRLPRLVRPTFTSREIGMLKQLPQPARTAFSDIAGVVERVLFAGQKIGQPEFAHCRRIYESFAFPSTWQAQT